MSPASFYPHDEEMHGGFKLVERFVWLIPIFYLYQQVLYLLVPMCMFEPFATFADLRREYSTC